MNRRIRSTSRRQGVRPPAARISVFTEGSVTEPKYLKAFERAFRNTSINLRPVGVGGDPRAVVERAIADRKSTKRDPLAVSDTTWVMFDRDAHQRFEEAIDMASANSIHLAVSNPCFELWAVLHYQDQDAHVERGECQRKLESLCSSYGKGKGKVFDDLETISNAYELAVNRARNLQKRRSEEGTPDGNPSTGVHRLTEHIRNHTASHE